MTPASVWEPFLWHFFSSRYKIENRRLVTRSQLGTHFESQKKAALVLSALAGMPVEFKHNDDLYVIDASYDSLREARAALGELAEEVTNRIESARRLFERARDEGVHDLAVIGPAAVALRAEV